jgi:hypothetical protein
VHDALVAAERETVRVRATDAPPTTYPQPDCGIAAQALASRSSNLLGSGGFTPFCP